MHPIAISHAIPEKTLKTYAGERGRPLNIHHTKGVPSPFKHLGLGTEGRALIRGKYMGRGGTGRITLKSGRCHHTYLSLGSTSGGSSPFP